MVSIHRAVIVSPSFRGSAVPAAMARLGRALGGAMAGKLPGYALAVATAVAFILASRAFAPPHSNIATYGLFTYAALVTAALGGTGPAILSITAMLIATIVSRAMGALPDQDGSLLLFLSGTACVVILFSTRIDVWRRHARRQEARVRRVAEELSILIDGAEGLAICMLTPFGHVSHWSRGAERIIGWNERDIQGADLSIFYRAEDVQAGKPAADLERARQFGRLEEEVEVRRRDGSSFYAHCALNALYDQGGKLRGFARVVQDISVEHAQERALAVREALFRAALETIPFAMFVVTKDAEIIHVNGSAEAMFGRERNEFLGTRLHSVLPELGSIMDIAAEAAEMPREMNAVRADGATCIVDVTLSQVSDDGPDDALVTALVRDLSANQTLKARIETLQMEVLHGSRRSAMGTMASTLAHEINQPITAIANYVEGSRGLLTRGDAGALAKADKVLASAASEAIRVGAIVSRLRSFVDRGEMMLEVLDLDEALRGALALVRRGAFLNGVEIELDIDPSASPVLADRIQLQQVLINLCRNAFDSMRSQQTRRLLISAVPVDAETTHVIVEDTGTGLAPEVADRLFDAFVTNKANGLGVGLSICRTIIEAHGGRIWATSSPGTGAAFHFTLKRPREDER